MQTMVPQMSVQGWTHYALPSAEELPVALGFRTGARGTQARRTSMLRELQRLLSVVSRRPTRDECFAAIVDQNVLGKITVSNRRLTAQHLGLRGAVPSP